MRRPLRVSWALLMFAALAVWMPDGVLAQSKSAAARPVASARPSSSTARTITGSLAMPPAVEQTYAVDGRTLDEKVFLYRQLAIIQAHLLVGYELIEEARWEEALPHVLRTHDELYAQVAPLIRTRALSAFGLQLKALAQAIKASRRSSYDDARLMLQMRLDNTLDKARRQANPAATSALTARTLIEVLKVALASYGAWTDENGSIVAYQAGRGCFLYAYRMFETLAPDIEAADAATVDAIRWTFVELKSAWPRSVAPPGRLMAADDVTRRVARIEELMAKFE